MATAGPEYPSWCYFPGEAPRLVQSDAEFTTLMANTPAIPVAGVVVATNINPVAVMPPGPLTIVQSVLGVPAAVAKWGKAPIVEYKPIRQRREREDR